MSTQTQSQLSSKRTPTLLLFTSYLKQEVKHQINPSIATYSQRKENPIYGKSFWNDQGMRHKGSLPPSLTLESSQVLSTPLGLVQGLQVGPTGRKWAYGYHSQDQTSERWAYDSHPELVEMCVSWSEHMLIKKKNYCKGQSAMHQINAPIAQQQKAHSTIQTQNQGDDQKQQYQLNQSQRRLIS